MMKKTKHRSWGRVKLILFVPLIVLLLQAFARPELITNTDDFIPVRYSEDQAEKWLEKWNADNIGKGIFDPEIDRDKLSDKENNILVILMNKNDEFLIEGERKLKGEVKQIVKDFLHGINPDGKNGPDYAEKDISGIGKIKVSEGIISYRHDVESSKEMINYTLQSIGEACLEARKEKAQILFGKDYIDLDKEKQMAVDMAVPVRFSFESPKGVKKRNKLSFDEEQKRAQVDLELAKAESNIFKNVGGISFEEEQNKARIDQALVNSNSVVIADEVELLIPEGFSPNGDGIHDFFEIKGIYPENPNAKLVVFDKQGKKVFEQENYGNISFWDNGKEWWDGTSKNGKLEAGKYNYQLELGNGEVKKGTLLLAMSPSFENLRQGNATNSSNTFNKYNVIITSDKLQAFNKFCTVENVKQEVEEALKLMGDKRTISVLSFSDVPQERSRAILNELNQIPFAKVSTTVLKLGQNPASLAQHKILLKANGRINLDEKEYNLNEFVSKIREIGNKSEEINVAFEVENDVTYLQAETVLSVLRKASVNQVGNRIQKHSVRETEPGTKIGEPSKMFGYSWTGSGPPDLEKAKQEANNFLSGKGNRSLYTSIAPDKNATTEDIEAVKNVLLEAGFKKVEISKNRN